MGIFSICVSKAPKIKITQGSRMQEQPQRRSQEQRYEDKGVGPNPLEPEPNRGNRRHHQVNDPNDIPDDRRGAVTPPGNKRGAQTDQDIPYTGPQCKAA